MSDFRALTKSDIESMRRNGCSAVSWDNLRVAENFDAERLHHVAFSGAVQLGSFHGTMKLDGLERPCGIYNARLHDCTIGDNVLIENIGSMISNYHIGDGVAIENVFSLYAEKEAGFGSGVEVSVLNESGGREVLLCDELDAQTAYLQAMIRHDPAFQQKLRELTEQHIKLSRKPHGVIGDGAQIRHVGLIKNVHIGEAAHVFGAQEMHNGEILSCVEHPARIGAGVTAHDFIIAEGASVDSGATLEKVYVGQGTQLGKSFSAENALFFANCEGFHSEVAAVFAGPYSVTHHRSTLLIGSLFSFYNAGSGSNQSNHMYKLGPVHQGIFERGCKTGSFSYAMLESHLAAFSTLIGKHLTNIDLPDLPFSYFSEKAGVSHLTPAINLFAVGTRRDEAKWPARDRRRAARKRDLINFAVFSPYTVEKMRRGRDELLQYYQETPREKSHIVLGGSHINRLLLRKSAKYYAYAVNRWLIGRLMHRVAAAAEQATSWETLRRELTCASDLNRPDEWLDIAGLLAAKERITALMHKLRDGEIENLQQLQGELQRIHDNFSADEWAYVCQTCAAEYGASPAEMTLDAFAELMQKWASAANSLAVLTLDDAEKEFAEFSRIGFGLGFGEEEKQKDFTAVRGSAETNTVVQQLRREKEQIELRLQDMMLLLKKF